MMAAAFARRLGQMGLRAWGLDDTTVPRLGAGDPLVACTGSGDDAHGALAAAARRAAAARACWW